MQLILKVQDLKTRLQLALTHQKMDPIHQTRPSLIQPSWKQARLVRKIQLAQLIRPTQKALQIPVR